jgi:AraC-like DNA-binding protein
MRYENWEMRPPHLSGRSYFYDITPVAGRTFGVESLTSYLMRLAAAHAVNVGTLIIREILPRVPEGCAKPMFKTFHTLNGMGSRSELWVQTIEELTTRTDVRFLTLLPWRNLFNIQGLLRPNRAWCPHCYEEQRFTTQEFYDCLLWTLLPVQVCTVHRVHLEQYCPRCQKMMRSLSGSSRPAHCCHCGTWLGSEFGSMPGQRPDGLEEELWIANGLGELLSSSAPQSPEILHANLHRALKQWAGGNQLGLARSIGIGQEVMTEWVRKDRLPSLTTLIRFGQAFNLPLRRFVAENMNSDDVGWRQAQEIFQAKHASFIKQVRAKQRQGYIANRPWRWALSSSERAADKTELKDALEAALCQEIPRTVRNVVLGLGYKGCSIARYSFPELCAAIVQKRKHRFRTVELQLQTAICEQPPPSVSEIARRIGSTPERLYRQIPDICAVLIKARSLRQHFRERTFAQHLTDALEECPPPTLHELARRLGKDNTYLRKHFPDLWSDLRRRFLDYRKQQACDLASSYEVEVRHAFLAITALKAYPSRDRVLEFISKANSSLKSVYQVSKALHRIRATLSAR